MATIEERLTDLYDELLDILRYSPDGKYDDPTADVAVVRTEIINLLKSISSKI